MKVSIQRRFSKKPKPAARLTKKGSVDSDGHSRDYVPIVPVKQRASSVDRMLEGTKGEQENHMEREFEAVSRNWSRFIGFPMQMLLLVGRLEILSPFKGQIFHPVTKITLSLSCGVLKSVIHKNQHTWLPALYCLFHSKIQCNL